MTPWSTTLPTKFHPNVFAEAVVFPEKESDVQYLIFELLTSLLSSALRSLWLTGGTHMSRHLQGLKKDTGALEQRKKERKTNKR